MQETDESQDDLASSAAEPKIRVTGTRVSAARATSAELTCAAVTDPRTPSTEVTRGHTPSARARTARLEGRVTAACVSSSRTTSSRASRALVTSGEARRARPSDGRAGAGRPIRSRDERGSATAETAVVLPVMLLVLAMAVWVLAAVSAQLSCTDAAGVAARAAARGDDAAAVTGAGRAVAPEGATVDVAVGAELVEVRVRARVRPLGGALSALPAIEVSGRAVAAREDRVGTS